MRIIFSFALLLLVVSLFGCGSDGGSPAVPTDGLLPGAGTDLAILHVVNYDNAQGVEETDVVMSADGRHIALTQLEVWLADSATVAGVNQALQTNGARIISMITNVPILLLEISRPEDYSALGVVAERLASSPAIKKVNFVDMPFPGSLPLNHSDDDIGSLNEIYQLIATKNLAARNAKHALTSSLSIPPTIIVVDFFGNGLPGPAFDIVTDAADYSLIASGEGDDVLNRKKEHGYHVLGIISALDGGDSKVTGAYPDTSLIKVVDLIVSPTRYLSQAEWENKIVQTMVDNPGVNHVVNTSLAITCGPAGASVPCPAADLQEMAYSYITKVRSAGDSGLESSYLHVSAAGNVPEGFTYAYEAAPVNYASLRTDVVDGDGVSVSPLSNVITVENVMIDTATADLPAFAYCLSANSVSGGHVSAPGNGITSFIDATGSEANKSGSSMAAPQVAAAAAYLWALEPELTPQEIKQHLIATGEPLSGGGSGCSSEDSKPFLDAYRVILMADDVRSLLESSPVAGRVRGTILDVADATGNPGANGQFDEKDIALFLSVYEASDSVGALDYSRYDLNGNGWTGGTLKDTFDLDMDRLIEAHPLQLDGFEQDLDENEVTDKNILCYYAYSHLYTGSVSERDDLLLSTCSPPVFHVYAGNPIPDITLNPIGLNASLPTIYTETYISNTDIQRDWSMDPPDSLPDYVYDEDCMASSSTSFEPNISKTYSAYSSTDLASGTLSTEFLLNQEGNHLSMDISGTSSMTTYIDMINEICGTGNVNILYGIGYGYSDRKILIDINNVTDEVLSVEIAWDIMLTGTDSQMWLIATGSTELYRPNECVTDYGVSDGLRKVTLFNEQNNGFVPVTGKRIYSIDPGRSQLYLILRVEAGAHSSCSTSSGATVDRDIQLDGLITVQTLD